MPVLEAMAQGTPVVTSNSTSTAEVAGEAGVLVDPLDVGAIADAIRALLDDPSEAGRLGEEGQERAKAFTWERTAELVAGVYAEAAAATPTPAGG